MSLNKIGRNSALTSVGRNYKKLLTPVTLTLISAIAFAVIEVEAFVIVCHNVVVLLSMLFIKSISTCI